MVNLFKKAAVFGDIHFGKRSDSPVHNQDCLEYVQWFCDQANAHKVDTIIFLGDWFDNRSRLRLDTQDAGNKAMRMLLEVAPVYVIVGNHDMFFRNSRSIHSIDAYEEWDGVTIINDPVVIGNVGLVPFLIGTEYLEVLDLECKYMFGHFELPGFLMNSTIEMPDRGGLNAEQFSQVEAVFSGHFHKRQLKKNKGKIPVWYIGSPFGHDFNDVHDLERGMMILEWDKQPQFIDWEEGPLYQRFSIAHVIDMLEDGELEENVRPTSILEVKDEVGLDLEDIAVIREELNKTVREARVYQGQTTPSVDMETELEDLDNKTLDQVVVEHLLQIDPHGSEIEPERLVKLFRGD